MQSHLQARRRGSHSGERGYVLLSLLLVVAMIVILAAAILPTIKFQIERDREEEMIHRGVQYSRAIRGYYKKFGRYPVKIEDLESTNNMRFLRKRYKDPTNCGGGTCKDFRFLHFGEVKLTFGGLIPGATPILQPGAPGFSPTPAAPGTPNTPTGLGQIQQQPPNPTAGVDPSQTSTVPDQNTTPSQPVSGNGASDPGSSDQPVQQFGGGPIVGVVSTNKKDGYREFNHKRKYNEWQFIYDPGTDRGGLLMTPNQPPLIPLQSPQNVNGQPGASNGIGTGNGFGNTFGTSPTGLQNNPTPPPSGQTPPSSDPNNPPQ